VGADYRKECVISVASRRGRFLVWRSVIAFGYLRGMETQAQLEQAVPGFLNERSVSLLESRWADLRHEAYAESLESGFRIHLLGPSQAFVEAGFRDNDVVASN